MAHTITVLNTEGCAGAPEAVRAARAIAASREDVMVETRLIEDEAQALEHGFRGSPTVVVDGADVEEQPQAAVGTMG